MTYDYKITIIVDNNAAAIISVIKKSFSSSQRIRDVIGI